MQDHDTVPTRTTGQYRTVTSPPAEYETRPPFWARFGYHVVAVVLAAVIGVGTVAFNAYRSVQSEWVEVTRRVDSLDGRQEAVDKRVDNLDNRVSTLVTKSEFESWSKVQSDAMREVKDELVRLRESMERRR